MKNLATYVTGYVLSVLLTLFAFALVAYPGSFGIPGGYLIAKILILAFLQLIVQLMFFLHLASERGPRWKALAFVSTLALVLIVIVASIWIMAHLNYNMSPAQVNEYLQQQQGGF